MKILRRISAGRRRRGEDSALRVILHACISHLMREEGFNRLGRHCFGSGAFGCGEGLPLSGSLNGSLLGIVLTSGHAEVNDFTYYYAGGTAR